MRLRLRLSLRELLLCCLERSFLVLLLTEQLCPQLSIGLRERRSALLRHKSGVAHMQTPD